MLVPIMPSRGWESGARRGRGSNRGAVHAAGETPVLVVVPDVVVGVVGVRCENQEDGVGREAVLDRPEHRRKVNADLGSPEAHLLPPRAVIDNERQLAL